MNTTVKKYLCAAMSAVTMAACVVVPSALNTKDSKLSIVNSVEADASIIDGLKFWERRQVTSNTGLNIRKGPGTSYEKVGAYNYGDVVTVFKKQNGWGLTIRGWISLAYTKVV